MNSRPHVEPQVLSLGILADRVFPGFEVVPFVVASCLWARPEFLGQISDLPVQMLQLAHRTHLLD